MLVTVVSETSHRTAVSFAKLLRKWRGTRFQKEAAALLGVELRTYVSWEQGVHEPRNVCRRCLLELIEQKR